MSGPLSTIEASQAVAEGSRPSAPPMGPHAITAVDGPAELTMVLDREGQRAQVHQ